MAMPILHAYWQIMDLPHEIIIYIHESFPIKISTHHVIRIKIFDDSLYYYYESSVNVKMANISNFGLCLGNSSLQSICVIVVLVVFLGVCDANSYCKKHKAKQILKLPSKGMIAGKIFFYLNQSIFSNFILCLSELQFSYFSTK